jgi:hypothetical protein
LRPVGEQCIALANLRRTGKIPSFDADRTI